MGVRRPKVTRMVGYGRIEELTHVWLVLSEQVRLLYAPY